MKFPFSRAADRGTGPVSLQRNAIGVVTRRRRRELLLWLSSVVAVVLLVLGINGTLSAWTNAIVHNDTNTARAAGSVALAEFDGADDTDPACVDTADDGTNEATCAGIDTYGGVTTPLAPGQSQTSTVTLKNTGSETGTLTLGADAPTGGSADADLATVLQVTVSCTAADGTTTTAYPADGDPAVTPATFDSVASPWQITASLAAGATETCTIGTSIPADTAASYAGQTISQSLTWTLTANPIP